MNSHQRRVAKREADRFVATPRGKAVVTAIDNLQAFCDNVRHERNARDFYTVIETDLSSVVPNRSGARSLLFAAAYGKGPIAPRVMTPNQVLE